MGPLLFIYYYYYYYYGTLGISNVQTGLETTDMNQRQDYAFNNAASCPEKHFPPLMLLSFHFYEIIGFLYIKFHELLPSVLA